MGLDGGALRRWWGEGKVAWLAGLGTRQDERHQGGAPARAHLYHVGSSSNALRAAIEAQDKLSK